ncbi:transketolase [Desulfallas thermosapovorans]|uniref:Uncharacterized protein n=1 Tax=Desulfallas thermosapovorans DSM 6562 TaxID=1121431 RepID=A0A5S4ZTB8_9FIRM|nr:transketolase [Desulfallas thermosapovorans]TYO95934.1 hypothetical protein LX24_01324 [Desulfallas thermosapovorans DSM 6562]
MPLDKSEKQLIKFIRDLGWGEVNVRVEEGKPVLICEAIRTFKLEEQPVEIQQPRKKGRMTFFNG